MRIKIDMITSTIIMNHEINNSCMKISRKLKKEKMVENNIPINN